MLRFQLLFTAIISLAAQLSFSQDKDEVTVTEPILNWYGLDFSILSVCDYTLLQKGEYVKETLCPAWQGYFKEQVSDEKLKKWFRKSVLYDRSSQFFKSASGLDVDSLVQIDGPKRHMTAEELKSHLKSYDLKEKEGLGFIAIVKRLSREDRTASVICVFFNIETREPVAVFGESGKKGGGDVVSNYGDGIVKAIKTASSNYRFQALGN